MTSASERPVTLILGATGGIGSELAVRLAQQGHGLHLAARSEEALDRSGRLAEAEWTTVDATDPARVDALFDDVVSRHGRLDGVAHCVGSIVLKPAHLTSPADWNETISLNLTSAFNVVRAAGKTMTRGGGSVVLVSSAAALAGLANHEAIAAAKAGVIGLARSAAATYAPRGLRFNAVAPGLVRTKMSKRFWSSEAGEKISASMHPLGRIGEPRDVASMIAWLLDPAQSWVTGQVFGIDGGLSAIRPKASAS